MLARTLLFWCCVVGGTFALGWSLIPPATPDALTHYNSPHTVSTANLDAYFRSTWTAEGITSSPEAPQLLQARRVALGLMGTVPSLEELRQFETLPESQRMAWWVDHVLQDRRYADYFAERLGRSFVGTEDGPFILYRRRRFVSWLSDELMVNRPYDALVRTMITSRGLWTDHPETNFISVTAQNDKKNQPDPVRLGGRVTRAFLGLRLDCAQCHDHPFTDWKQSDFEGFSAFFGQTHIGMTGVHDGKGEYEVEDKKTQQLRTVPPSVPFGHEYLPSTGTRRERLATWTTHPTNRYFAAAIVNRVWALLFGRPIVEPVDNLESIAEFPPLLKLLADDFVANGHDLQRLIRLIVQSEAFRRDSASETAIGETEERHWAAFPLTRLRPEQVAGSVWQAGSIATLDSESHILQRLVRFGQTNDFLKRYGDTGEDEFDNRGGTIPQRLILMNGKLVSERFNENPFNATSRLAWMARDDRKLIETAFLAVLSRRPTDEEATHFLNEFQDRSTKRTQRVEDLFWSLTNVTEFSWNH